MAWPTKNRGKEERWTNSNWSTPINSESKPVDASLIANVQVVHLDLALMHDEPCRDHQADHRAKEDCVTTQHAEEDRGSVYEFPRVSDNGQGDGQVRATANIDELGKSCSKIEAYNKD
jgi:hypothetical protein